MKEHEPRRLHWRKEKIPPEFVENYSESRPVHRRLRTRLLNHYLVLALLIVLQVSLIVGLFVVLGSYFSAVVNTLFSVLSVLVCINIMDRDTIAPAYKTFWMFLIMLLPLAGLLFYLFWGQRSLHTRSAGQYRACWNRRKLSQTQEESAAQQLTAHFAPWAPTCRYLYREAGAPVFDGTHCTYYPFGEDVFTQYLADLEKAEKFIFIEYFIIDSGVFWNSALEVLRRKAAQGVDVRVIYDSVGSLLTLPLNYFKQLRQWGIRCYKFAPVHVSIHLQDYTMMNHRDHRKITVIDGEVGFTGGINFADEYINLRRPYGIWKDTAVRLEGKAVYGLTSSFLEVWDYLSGSLSAFADYRGRRVCPSDTLVQPYGESPLVPSNVAAGLYLNLLQRSRRSVYIITPYLVIDNELLNSLLRAAQSGLDVRLILPGIPDKRLVYTVTRSYYPILLQSGVRVYEYSPGFTHAKMALADDSVAVIGTANLDYRSLYLHFENCCVFYGGQIVQDVRRDFERTLSQCHEITPEDEKRRGLPTRLYQGLARIVAPLI